MGSIASQVLGGGLGVVSLVSGLAKLFGGDDSGTPPPLVSYTRPDTINFDGDSVRADERYRLDREPRTAHRDSGGG